MRCWEVRTSQHLWHLLKYLSVEVPDVHFLGGVFCRFEVQRAVPVRPPPPPPPPPPLRVGKIVRKSENLKNIVLSLHDDHTRALVSLITRLQLLWIRPYRARCSLKVSYLNFDLGIMRQTVKGSSIGGHEAGQRHWRVHSNQKECQFPWKNVL